MFGRSLMNIVQSLNLLCEVTLYFRIGRRKETGGRRKYNKNESRVQIIVDCLNGVRVSVCVCDGITDNAHWFLRVSTRTSTSSRWAMGDDCDVYVHSYVASLKERAAARCCMSRTNNPNQLRF